MRVNNSLPGTQSLSGPLHFHESYLLELYQVSTVKMEKKSIMFLAGGGGKDRLSFNRYRVVGDEEKKFWVHILVILIQPCENNAIELIVHV